MSEQELYDCVKEIWRVSLHRAKTVDYVFGIYHSLIVVAYKPTEWLVCKEAKDKLPRKDIELDLKKENRLFFVDEGVENHKPKDEVEEFYLYKSIAGVKLNQSV